MQAAFELSHIFNLKYAQQIFSFNQVLEMLCGLPDSTRSAHRQDLMAALKRQARKMNIVIPESGTIPSSSEEEYNASSEDE